MYAVIYGKRIAMGKSEAADGSHVGIAALERYAVRYKSIQLRCYMFEGERRIEVGETQIQYYGRMARGSNPSYTTQSPLM